MQKARRPGREMAADSRSQMADRKGSSRSPLAAEACVKGWNPYGYYSRRFPRASDARQSSLDDTVCISSTGMVRPPVQIFDQGLDLPMEERIMEVG